MAASSGLINESDKEVFRTYIASRKILIVDPEATIRNGIARILVELGANLNNLALSTSFKEAQKFISSEKPHIVFSEYQLGARCGLELVQLQRMQQSGDFKKCIFLIVTRDTSQIAVTKSVEEDIDGYLIKPFLPRLLQNLIVKAALSKAHPSPYKALIDQAIILIEKKELGEAEKILSMALNQDSTPCLAYYYLGQVHLLREKLTEAMESFLKGLELNKIHFKCLNGIYNLHVRQNQLEEAYDVLKQLIKYFPSSAQRLSEVLKLAIQNQKYDDIEKYYLIYLKIDDRTSTLTKYMCAALVVCGKHYLNKKASSRAWDTFNKATSISQNHPNILFQIVFSLVEHSMVKDARQFMDKVLPKDRVLREYSILDFLISNKSGTSATVIISKGNALLETVDDPRIYKVIIERSIEANLKEAAEDLALKAQNKFPDRKDEFGIYLTVPSKKQKSSTD